METINDERKHYIYTTAKTMIDTAFRDKVEIDFLRLENYLIRLYINRFKTCDNSTKEQIRMYLILAITSAYNNSL